MKAECPIRELSDKYYFVGTPLSLRDISPFRGEKYFIKSDIKGFAPERLFPWQGKCLRQQTKGCPFPEEKMSALLTEGFYAVNLLFVS